MKIISSNQLESLADKLAGSLKKAGFDSDPFVELRVAVGNKGMEGWLKEELAGRLGICTAIEFPFPQIEIKHILDTLEEKKTDDKEKDDPWSTEALTWKILAAFDLKEVAGNKDFQMINGYLAGDPQKPAKSGGITPVCSLYTMEKPWEK